VIDLNANYQGACAVRSDLTLYCWGAGVQNVATPLILGAPPVDAVSLQTSCGSNNITLALRYLSTSSVYRRATTPRTILCP
jgi:hypothetical protein